MTPKFFNTVFRDTVELVPSPSEGPQTSTNHLLHKQRSQHIGAALCKDLGLGASVPCLLLKRTGKTHTPSSIKGQKPQHTIRTQWMLLQFSLQSGKKCLRRCQFPVKSSIRRVQLPLSWLERGGRTLFFQSLFVPGIAIPPSTPLHGGPEHHFRTTFLTWHLNSHPQTCNVQGT